MVESALFPERIETERLRLEQLTTENVDVVEYYRICSGQADGGDFEAVTRYLAWEPHAHPKETLDYLRGVEESIREGEGVTYAIRPRAGEDGAGEVAGAGSLGVDWERKTATLGAWLRRPFWGRGYSGERAAALIELAFERLDLELVAVTHQAGNEKSRRAIEKYVEAHGGQHEGLFRNLGVGSDGDPVDQHRYTIEREQYREATGGRAGESTG